MIIISRIEFIHLNWNYRDNLKKDSKEKFITYANYNNRLKKITKREVRSFKKSLLNNLKKNSKTRFSSFKMTY
jgi:hypothetical protein